MFEHVNKESKPKRDRMLIWALLAVAVIVAALTPPIYIALNTSYRYHEFVIDYSKSLTAARQEEGVIWLTLEDGTDRRVSADNVSSTFLELTGYGFGQPMRKLPADVSPVTVTLPDGTVLSFYDTPSDNGLEIPTGVTVHYAPPEGKPFIYLQRYIAYEDLVRPLMR